MSTSPDVLTIDPKEILNTHIPHVVHGKFSAVEKYAFQANRLKNGTREGQPLGFIDVEMSGPILSNPYRYFFDRLGIPYQKKGLKQAGIEKSNGACYAIFEPDTDGLSQIAFSGIVDKYDRRHLRPTLTTFSLNFDNRASALSVLDVIKKGALSTVLYPFLHTFFTVKTPTGSKSLFDSERKEIGLQSSDFDSFNMPMTSLVVGQRTARSGPLDIIFDSRPNKVFEPQVIPE